MQYVFHATNIWKVDIFKVGRKGTKKMYTFKKYIVRMGFRKNFYMTLFLPNNYAQMIGYVCTRGTVLIYAKSWKQNILILLRGRKKILSFLVFANKPTVHNGGVSRGRVCDCGCWHYWQVAGGRGQVTHDTWHQTLYIFLFVVVSFGIGATICTHIGSQCLPCDFEEESYRTTTTTTTTTTTKNNL